MVTTSLALRPPKRPEGNLSLAQARHGSSNKHLELLPRPKYRSRMRHHERTGFMQQPARVTVYESLPPRPPTVSTLPAQPSVKLSRWRWALVYVQIVC